MTMCASASALVLLGFLFAGLSKQQALPRFRDQHALQKLCSNDLNRPSLTALKQQFSDRPHDILEPSNTFVMLLLVLNCPAAGWHVVGQHHVTGVRKAWSMLAWDRGVGTSNLVASSAADSDIGERLTLRLDSSADTLALGAALADGARAGDVLLLHGDYGAGKTCLARGFLQHWYRDPNELVTSPSYLIDNVYPDDEGRALQPGVTVHHMDLWRLPHGKVQQLVDLPLVFSECISLIEWPDRLGSELMPAEHLDLQIAIEGSRKNHSQRDDEEHEDFEDAPRIATLTARGVRWQERLAKLKHLTQ